MMFNADSNCVHPSFWIRPLMLTPAHILVRFMRICRKSISWNQVLWSLAVSNIIPCDSWYPRKSPYVSWFIFKIIYSWWFLVDFLCSRVTPLDESASHPLIRRMSGPRLLFRCPVSPWSHYYSLSWAVRKQLSSTINFLSPLCVSTNFWALRRPCWPRLTASNQVNYHILHLSKSMLQQISRSASSIVMSF